MKLPLPKSALAWKRFWSSAPYQILFMFLGIFASVGVVYFSQTSTSKPQGSALPFWFLGAIFILGFLLIFLFTLAEYRRRTYDPVLILKWQEIFDDMKNERDAAARAMIEYLSVPKSDRNWRRVAKAKPANLEDVFDFLDDLGFYMEGSQFSSEVVHHHFYNWIRIYLQEGLSYITQNRANKHEPKKWYHCESLLKQVEEIETTQNPFETNLNWDDDKLKEYLSYEVINANQLVASNGKVHMQTEGQADERDVHQELYAEKQKKSGGCLP